MAELQTAASLLDISSLVGWYRYFSSLRLHARVLVCISLHLWFLLTLFFVLRLSTLRAHMGDNPETMSDSPTIQDLFDSEVVIFRLKKPHILILTQ